MRSTPRGRSPYERQLFRDPASPDISAEGRHATTNDSDEKSRLVLLNSLRLEHQLRDIVIHLLSREDWQCWHKQAAGANDGAT